GFTLDVAFSADGPVTALVGPSGSGKTSVLSVLAGLRRPRRGGVVLDGGGLFDSERGGGPPPEARARGPALPDPPPFPPLVGRPQCSRPWGGGGTRWWGGGGGRVAEGRGAWGGGGKVGD